MEKEPLFLTLSALFALLFSQVCLADVNAQQQIMLLIESNKTMSLIDANDFAAASAVIEKMKVNFAGNTEMPRLLYRIAYEYEKVGAFEQAKSLNAQVVTDFPNNIYRANAELQLAKLKIYELIDAGDYKAVDSAISQVLVDFENVDFLDNENLPRRLYEAANRYDKVSAFEQAKALCTRIVADYPKDIYAKYASLLLARFEAYDLIAAGNYDSADSTTSKMMDDFAVQKQLPKRLWEIANRFDKFKAYNYSKTLCEKIVANYPDDTYAGYAGLQLAKLKVYELIDKGDYASADLVVCEAIKNFAGHKQLSRRLYEIARQYAKSGALSYAKPLYGWLAAGYPDDKYGLRAASDYRALGDSVPDAGVSKVADLAVPKTNLNQTAKLTDASSVETFASDISSQIVSGEPAAVKTAIGMLITDFNDSSHLFDVLSGIIGICYKDYYYNTGETLLDGTQPDNKLLRTITENLEYYVQNGIPCGKSSDAYINFPLGQGFNLLGEYPKAVLYLTKAMETDPDFERTMSCAFAIGQCYEKMAKSGNMPKEQAIELAKKYYQQMLEQNPDKYVKPYITKWLKEH